MNDLEWLSAEEHVSLYFTFFNFVEKMQIFVSLDIKSKKVCFLKDGNINPKSWHKNLFGLL